MKYVNFMSADSIVLAGDIVDGSISGQDMEVLKQALLAMRNQIAILQEKQNANIFATIRETIFAIANRNKGK